MRSIIIGFVALFFSSLLLAFEHPCGWESSEDLMVTEFEDFVSDEYMASKVDALDDIRCLKHIIANYYAGSLLVDEIHSVLENMDQLSDVLLRIQPDELSKPELMRRFILAQRTMLDTHFSYQLEGYGQKAFEDPEPHFIDLTINAEKHWQCGDNWQRFVSYDRSGVKNIVFIAQFSPSNAPLLASCTDPNGSESTFVVRNVKKSQIAVENSFDFKEEADHIYVRLTTMEPINERHQELLDLIVARENKPIIIDLRGNSGGSTSFPEKFAASLSAKSRLLHEYQIQEKQSLVHVIAQKNTIQKVVWNFERMGRLEEAQNYASYLPKLDQLIERLKIEFETPWDTTRNIYSYPLYGNAESDFDEKILVIVDETCASSCEDFLLMLRNHPSVQIIGTHSAGTGKFGEMGTIILPKTKIQVSFGRKIFKGYDFQEGFGFEPEIYIVNPEDSMVVAKKLLFQ